MKSYIYSNIFESVPLGLIVADRLGHIREMNSFAGKILSLGDTPEEAKRLHELLGPVATEQMLAKGGSGKPLAIRVNHREKILEIEASPLKSGKDGTDGIVITVRDVTESERVQAAEKNFEKHSLIGDLSADIAHEIRNPLGSIELLASLLKKESKRAKDVNRAKQIMAAVRNVESAISNLIYRSKRDRLPVSRVNVHDILREIMLHSEKIIDGGSVFLTARYADVEPVVECNAEMLKQVFLHLILTALPGAGRLDISTQYIEDRRTIEIHFVEKGKTLHGNETTGDFHTLSRSKGDIWGLGLAIVHNIVDMYKGSMRVEYREGTGPALVFSFPVLYASEALNPGEESVSRNGRKEANEEK